MKYCPILGWIILCFLTSPKMASSDPTTQESNNSSEMSYEAQLLSNILAKKYLDLRPTSCPKCEKSTIVNVSLNIIQILGFKESNEFLKLSGWFTFSWMDYRLKWKPSDYGNQTILSLPSSIQLWRPDIGLINNVEMSLFDLSSDSKPRLKIYPDGKVIWMHGIVMEVTCPLDVSSFPFDSQECYIIVTPWQSGIDQVMIVPQQLGSAVQNEYLPNSNVSEWTITSMHQKILRYDSPEGGRYQYITFSLKMRRQPLYFVILVIIPFGILSFLACLIFTLKEASDRLSVALSILLSMTMYVAIVSSNTPRSMRTLPAICIYCLVQLSLLSAAIIWSVITCNLIRCDTSLCGLRHSKQRNENSNNDANLKIENKGDRDFQEQCCSLANNETNNIQEKSRSILRKLQIEKTKSILDGIGIVLYLVLTILNGWVCLIYMPSHTTHIVE